VCPAHDIDVVMHLAGKPNAESAGESPGKHGAAARPGALVLQALDGAGRRRAGCHGARKPLAPAPASQPEEPPTERIILQLKENRFANRVFDGLAARVEGSGP